MKPDQQTIRELAYRIWEERGRRDGRADDDWFTAEHQLTEQSEVAAGVEPIKLFPAGDSIASAVPNKPPANVQVQLDEVNAAYSGAKRDSATPSKPKKARR